MIAMQDLFMLSLPAMPEFIESYYEQHNFSVLTRVIFVLAFINAGTFFTHNIIRAAAKAVRKISGGDLFTLSIVAYALMMATVSEDLQLSIEAESVFAVVLF